MSRQGRILYLNGLTSTGKTSIVRELQARKEHLFYALGFDLFEGTLPEWAADTDENYAGAILAMYAAARSLSEQGRDVLIDGLIMNIAGLERHDESLRRALAGCPLYLINVHCPMEILRQRNLARGDPRENQSLDQSRIAEKNIDYALALDTGVHSPSECADLLLAFLAEREG